MAAGWKAKRGREGRAQESTSAARLEDCGGSQMKSILLSIIKVIVDIFLAGLASKTGCGNCSPS